MKCINPNIPAVMFHALSYGSFDPFYLSFPADYFRDTVMLLREKGYDFLTVSDILHQRKPFGDKSVCLTFDDGFEDNYSVLFPILKELNVNVTIFISGEFIIPGKREHVQKESKWVRPFLTEEQVLEMHRSGFVDFQNHTMTHTWYPISGKITNACSSSEIEEHYWVYWNRYLSRKQDPSVLNMRQTASNGFVLFENSRALNCKRFIPEKDEFDAVGTHVGNVIGGKKESLKEQEERYEYEIIHSKKYLEELLDKEIDFLCWPGGEFDTLSWRIYQQAEYVACTLPSNSFKRNRALSIMNTDARVLVRMGSSCRCRGIDLGYRELVRRIGLVNNPNPIHSLYQRIIRRLSFLYRKLLRKCLR